MRGNLIVGALVVGAAGAGLYALQTRQASDSEAGPSITVYKTPTLGCCDQWVGHLQDNGFAVKETNVSEAKLAEVREDNGVSGPLAGCHTALVEGYAVEGHVPAEDILRMLEERPEIAGLAVRGMPAGSPGMDQPGGRKEPYVVIAFDEEGTTRVYARH
jgi:hypothetical protein